jgi:NADH-quinone oxidoreductase subunit C
MEPMEIAQALEAEFTTDVVEVTTFRDQVAVTVNREKIGPVCRWLRDDPRIEMDFLSDICAVDFPESELRFEVVYNLYSLAHRHRIRIKTRLPEDELAVDSVVSVWKAADWFEREAFDLFGIEFRNHRIPQPPGPAASVATGQLEGVPVAQGLPTEGAGRLGVPRVRGGHGAPPSRR